MTIRCNTLFAAAISSTEAPSSSAATVITMRPPMRSISQPIITWLAPLTNQPTDAASETAATPTPNSVCQVSTKMPNPCRIPMLRNMAKNRAPATYQP